MDWSLFWRGLVLGISIAAPVGPIGVLCIRRALTGGAWQGLASGLGAATADAAYGSVAAFGLTLVTEVLVAQQTWLRLGGGAFLLGLGLRTLLSRPADQEDAPESRGGLAGAYFSTVLLTLTNPLTILSYAAIFAGLGLAAGAGNPASSALLVAGIFSGSALWWVMLSFGASRLGGWLTPARLLWVNRASGLLIAGFGLAALMGR
jgi:threonine/homoserine/homoserine lactone efflux protein